MINPAACIHASDRPAIAAVSAAEAMPRSTRRSRPGACHREWWHHRRGRHGAVALAWSRGALTAR